MGPTPITPADTLMKLPKINLSEPGLVPGTPTWVRVRSDVFRSLEEFGCFEAVHENLIPAELHGNLLMKDGLIEELFGLPMEVKRRFVDSSRPFSGYMGWNPMLPLTQYVAINGVLDHSPVNVIKNVTDLLWPDGNSTLCEVLLDYAKKLSTLDLLVKRMVFEELGVEKYLESHVQSTFHTIRINRYAAAANTREEQIGASPHCDKNFLTILQQNQVDGLKVQTKQGNWIKLSFASSSSFIVLVGESFTAWSNGRLRSPRHQVVMSGGDQTRLSIGLFSAVAGTVKCPEELVDEEHPLLFKPFEEIELLRYAMTVEGRKAESTLTAYCGV